MDAAGGFQLLGRPALGSGRLTLVLSPVSYSFRGDRRLPQREHVFSLK